MAKIPENALQVALPYKGKRSFSLMEWHGITSIVKAQRVQLEEAINIFNAENEVVATQDTVVK